MGGFRRVRRSPGRTPRAREHDDGVLWSALNREKVSTEVVLGGRPGNLLKVPSALVGPWSDADEDPERPASCHDLPALMRSPPGLTVEVALVCVRLLIDALVCSVVPCSFELVLG